jgi:hypothetical protein
MNGFKKFGIFSQWNFTQPQRKERKMVLGELNIHMQRSET